MNENYAMAQATGSAVIGGDYRPPSLTEQMQMRKTRLEEELVQVNKVLEGLAKNPDAAELFNAISRLGGLR